MYKLNLNKLAEELYALGYNDTDIAKEISMNVKSFRRKLKGNRTQELTTAEWYALSEIVGKPLDMFMERAKL